MSEGSKLADTVNVPCDGPVPTVMPIDRENWARQLHLSNFVNAYYELRDVSSLDAGRDLLIVGPGQGLEVEIFRWRGFNVSTLDIDETFAPDTLGSVHRMPMYSDAQFDVLVASHVLEHLPPTYLDAALSEIARVARYAVIYLPVTGRSAHLRIRPGFRELDFSCVVDVFNPLNRPSTKEAKFCSGQHYWEVGRFGFSRKAVVGRFSNHFRILRAYRNLDWLPSYNFVLESLRWACR